MEQNGYTYTQKIGKTTYTVIVRESKEAKGTVYDKVKQLILNDYDNQYLGGGV